MARLQKAAKGVERFGQLPSDQGRRLAERAELVLDQRQIVQGVEDHILALVGTCVAGDDFEGAADHYPVDIAAHPHRAMAVGHQVIFCVNRPHLTREPSANHAGRHCRAVRSARLE